MASTHFMWLVSYPAVEAEGGLYPLHVAGLLPGSRGRGWPLPTSCRWFATWQSRLRVASIHTRWLVHYLAVEAESGLYPLHVAGLLPGSRGWGWPLPTPCRWLATRESRLRMASTHTMSLVSYLAVEAEGGLYSHQVAGSLPGSRGWEWPLRAPGGWFTTWQSRLRVASTRTRWLVHYLTVEAEGGLYPHQGGLHPHQVAGSLPGSRGWGWPLRAPGGWFTTWQSRLRVASTRTRWLGHYLAVEAEGGLYAHQVWPLRAPSGWFTTWQSRLRVASTRTRWLGRPSTAGDRFSTTHTFRTITSILSPSFPHPYRVSFKINEIYATKILWGTTIHTDKGAHFDPIPYIKQ